MLEQLSLVGEQILVILQDLWQEFMQAWSLIQNYVYDRLGQPGLYATYVVFGVVALTLAIRAIKFSVSALVYLVIPAVATAWLGSIMFATPFITLLPFTAAACSLIFFFKS